MLKKIIVVTIGVAMLTGIEVLYAQDEPQARPGRRQAVEGRQRRRGDIERPRRERAGRDDEAENPDAAIRRIRREIRQIEQQLKAIKQKVNTGAEAPKRRLTAKLQETEKQEKTKEGMHGDWVGRLQQPRRGRNLPMLQGGRGPACRLAPMRSHLPCREACGQGRWLDDLIKAYRENDRQKMGQLIRRMHQQRQRWQEAKPLSGNLPGRMGMKGRERGDRDEYPQRERMGQRGQGRNIWDEEAPWPPRMGQRGQGIPEQDEPESTGQDQWQDIEE
jgi:hypothetical protein